MKRLLMACALLGSAAYAHDSMTGFDRAKTVNLVGTIKGFGWVILTRGSRWKSPTARLNGVRFPARVGENSGHRRQATK